MTDLSRAVIPKSDQLNYDDFIAGQSRTITITDVKMKEGEQPVSYSYQGDNGKPWKPCKSMIRVLIGVWGKDAKAHIGRSLTLYGDPEVRFGGDKVGGIRISHMSGLDQPVAVSLTVTRGKRKPYIVEPLISNVADIDVEALKRAAISAAEKGMQRLKDWWTGIGPTKQKAVGGAEYLAELKKIADKAEGVTATEKPATTESQPA